MSEHSKIEWTDATWNPIVAYTETGKRGWHCEKVSPACDHCYAAAMNKRSDGLVGIGTGLNYATDSLAKVDISVHEKTLLAPLKWKKPRKIFVCSMTDLFGEWVTDEMIDRVFAVMALCPQHTFQVLTKRPERMLEWFSERWQGTSALPELGIHAGPVTGRDFVIEQRMLTLAEEQGMIDSNNDSHFTADGMSVVLDRFQWPLPSVWLGVTAENQSRWDARVPLLRQTPAAKRFVSVEPMLGAIQADLTGLDQIICGGESGRGARPMHPDWARSLRDQCQAAGVAFFLKQWGAWEVASHENGHFGSDMSRNGAMWVDADGTVTGPSSHGLVNPYAMIRVSKKKAGRLLDGREWSEFPL